MENGTPVYAETTVPAEQPATKGARCSGGSVAHLGCLRLILKVLELVLSFLAFVCEEVVKECNSCGGLYFFEFVSCSAFLLSVSILLLYCTSLYEKIGKDKVKQLDFWIIPAVGLFFLLASIIFAALNDATSTEMAAVVFGFFASIVFIVDAGHMILQNLKARGQRQPENRANTLNATENQPLNNQQV
ncbi:CKLF-like MARVEL transmembrane domain-containing protein 6 isoform X2 [Hemicordylus capensis]|nr:CKLF-like MARVEL transmembrane domain-containing protein 6 isoform X2 [Hemicordylus capensis]